MAASYIRIVFIVLVGIAVLMFGIGFVVGRRMNKSPWPGRLLAVGSILLLIGMLSGVHALAVSGSLITRQILVLWFEIAFALMGGAIVGLQSKVERRELARIVTACTALVCLATVWVQIRNVQPVLDTLQTAGLLKPKDDYKPETNKDCPANLQSVYNAFEQYAELNDKLPDAAKWQDDTDFTSRIPQDEWLHCPAVSNRHDNKFGYALNDAIAGKKLNLNGKPLKSLPGAATTPLLYDSTNTSKNAHDDVTSLPKPGRHGGRNNILYLDGHVAAVAPK